MEQEQHKFILQQLHDDPVCDIKNKYTERLQEISTPTVRAILNQKYTSGSDMKAVLCLFDTLFLSASKSKGRGKKGLYSLTKNINNWITRMEKLPVNSAEGFVYFTDFLSEDIRVVVKIPRRSAGFIPMVREYFLGVKAINKLRYLIPNFVYTLGAFLCPKPSNKAICNTDKKSTAFVLYEKIPGSSVENLLRTRELDFTQWLLLFTQLLLALEVAQREIRFTHFDLHAGNVMVRRKENFSYTVPLDGISYHINNPELLPVVIDFGMTSAYVEDRYIGSYSYMKYGMLNFMVPGYDMYKFMVFSASYAKDNNVKTEIMKLFRFFSPVDPYKVFESRNIGLSKAANSYCSDVTFSPVATYTPLMMVEWLFQNYSDTLRGYITVGPRRQYMPVHYSSTIREYDYIFNEGMRGRQKALALADECINIRPSYVMTKYNAKVLEEYNKSLRSPELTSRIKGINMHLNSTPHLITIDLAMLEKVFDIHVPTQEDLTRAVNNVLNITIRHAVTENKRKAVLGLNILVYQERLNPYLQFYFTILELGLYDIYSEWIRRFHVSNIYTFYSNNVTQNERAIRWGQTLLASIL